MDQADVYELTRLRNMMNGLLDDVHKRRPVTIMGVTYHPCECDCRCATRDWQPRQRCGCCDARCGSCEHGIEESLKRALSQDETLELLRRQLKRLDRKRRRTTKFGPSA